MRSLQKVRAVFQPKNMSTLKPECLPWVGKAGTWMASWLMDKDDPFPGQWAMGIDFRDEVWKEFPASWVPEEDLVIVEQGNG
jgi:hypothetical protein